MPTRKYLNIFRLIFSIKVDEIYKFRSIKIDNAEAMLLVSRTPELVNIL